MKAHRRDIQRRIAYEAARILTEHRSADHLYAIHKAAERLGIQDRRLLPNRQEIESALMEQQRLFLGEDQRQALDRLRQAALRAMQALSQFNPLLVGPVHEGTADRNSHIRLHLFADTPEEVAFVLSDLHIPWEAWDKAMRFGDGSRISMPGFRFTADEIPFELVVLPPRGHHSRPIDPLDNQPLKGTSTGQLAGLIAQR
jgi:hypothetical protein